ncbi:MAG: hypothetical protein M3516_07920 [Actinomycetota bacterium]|nr:hypothetical protein [Actinomycetota bacterium]
MIRWEEEGVARPGKSRPPVKRGLFTDATMSLSLSLDRLLSVGRKDARTTVGPRRLPSQDRSGSIQM